ncbi:MAG: DUF2173 family protein [bacterium]
MLKRLLAVDGVQAVVLFRDDGEYLEGYGFIPDEMMQQMATFAHEYKRLVQSNADQLSMFTQISSWTPPKGWMVRGAHFTICSVANLMCMMKNDEGNISEVMRELDDLAHS